MPVLSIFFGIVVRMWHDDHAPPHIHVEYQGSEALVEISTGEISKGSLSKKVSKIVKEWCLEHHEELSRNWDLAKRFEPLEKIKGADYD